MQSSIPFLMLLVCLCSRVLAAPEDALGRTEEACDRLAQEAQDVLRIAEEIVSHRDSLVTGVEISCISALRTFHFKTRELHRASKALGTVPVVAAPVAIKGVVVRPVITRTRVVPTPERRFKDLYWQCWSAAYSVERRLEFSRILEEARSEWRDSVTTSMEGLRLLLGELNQFARARNRGEMVVPPSSVSILAQ